MLFNATITFTLSMFTTLRKNASAASRILNLPPQILISAIFYRMPETFISNYENMKPICRVNILIKAKESHFIENLHQLIEGSVIRRAYHAANGKKQSKWQSMCLRCTPYRVGLRTVSSIGTATENMKHLHMSWVSTYIGGYCGTVGIITFWVWYHKLWGIMNTLFMKRFLVCLRQ